jgi:WD40 repeat protein
MISHHKRGSSGSGSSGNQWKKLFQTEAFEDPSETINFLTNTSDTKHKNSYDGSGTIYTNEGNFEQETTTKQLTKSKNQPSQAAIVTTTTTITTTPLQKYISGKHGKRSSSSSNKRYFDNVTQKRRWMIKEDRQSKDFNMSEVKKIEEEKTYSNLHNSSIELEQKSSQMMLKSKTNSIYKTQERMNTSKEESFFKTETDDSPNILGGPTTLKRKQWKIKYSLKCHLDAVRSLYFNMNMNIMASASEDRTIRLWKADTFCGKDIDEDFTSQQINSYMTLRGHTGALFAMSGPGDNNLNSNKKLLYSGGEEGVIRVWKIPSPIYYDSIESTHENQH